VVATVAHPTANLWRLPVVDRLVEDSDVQPYKETATERALAPRLAGTSLFYLSLNSRGTGDGLWRLRDGQAFEVRKAADDVLSDPPAPSPDGSQVVIVVRRDGKRRLALMSADGTNSRTLAPSLEVRSVDGRGAADWSPDGKWIAAGGDDGQGSGLFKIPVDGGTPVQLVAGEAVNPAWSPNGDLIVYAAARLTGEPLIANGRHLLRGVRPDGTRVALPEVRVPRGGAR
jgi:Tol biopolymer transport system component